MKVLINEVFRFSRAMHWIGGGVLVFMMLLTVADVVLRYLKMPILGVYELVSFSGATVIALALPLATLQKAHVCVDILFEFYPSARKKVLDVSTRCMGIFFFLILSWNLISMGTSFYRMGECTLTLQLPLYPIAYILGLSCAAECVVLGVDLIKTMSDEP